jgi:hypothetical protein
LVAKGQPNDQLDNWSISIPRRIPKDSYTKSGDDHLRKDEGKESLQRNI